MSDSLISLGLKSSVLQSYFETQEKIKHLTLIPSPATQALIDQQESIRRSFEPLIKFDTTIADSLKFPKYLESINRAIEPLTKFDTAFADSLKFPNYLEEFRRTLDTTKIDSVLKLTSAFKAFEHASSESLAISLKTPAIQSLYDHFKNTGDLNQWLSMAGSEAFGRVNVLDNTVVFDGIEIPNYGKKGTMGLLTPGDTIAIEPMATLGREKIVQEADGWTLSTKDGSLAAHFEHTVLITEDGAEILTRL